MSKIILIMTEKTSIGLLKTAWIITGIKHKRPCIGVFSTIYRHIHDQQTRGGRYFSHDNQVHKPAAAIRDILITLCNTCCYDANFARSHGLL